jgi:NADPH:quinone reductase-like Zn-dependent oxidoreductase
MPKSAHDGGWRLSLRSLRWSSPWGMIDAGELIVDDGVTLPLADAARAHEMLEALRQHPRGKIVLRTGA